MDTSASEKRIAFGETVKRLSPNKVGGYLVRFTDEDSPDLANDYFTAETYFGDRKTVPVLFHHGLNKKMGNTVLADGTLKVDEWGIWMEAVLDEREEYTKYVLGLVDKGALGLSSGAVGIPEWSPQAKANWIKSWVIGEGSLTHTPCEPKTLVVPMKSLQDTFAEDEKPKEAVKAGESDEAPSAPALEVDAPIKSEPTISTMPDNVTTTAPQEQPVAPVEQKQDMSEVMNAIKALSTRLDEREAASQKTVEPSYSAPAIITDLAERSKYNGKSTGQLALTVEVLRASPHAKSGPTDAIVREMAMRMDSSDTNVARPDVKAAWQKSFSGRVKANEIMQSTLASGGDEWVGVAYSSELWDGVYGQASVISQIPSFEFPAGAESMKDPIATGDPTVYKVAQASALATNPDSNPTNTVTASQTTTSNVTHTLSKFGARTLFTGELSEDSVLAVAQDLQNRFSRSFAETLESAVIDGDSDASATTNINDIAGTPAATDYFLNFDGFRKNALVTNTGNSYDVGALTAADFLEIAKLLGTAGLYAQKDKCAFILDSNTYWTAMKLPEVATRDVNSAATVESGMLTRMWGFPVIQSHHMHRAQASRKANTAGKIDLDTAGNNTTGSIVLTRWDRWKFGVRRRMTLETTRFAAADSTEIVAMFRGSLGKYDNDASAIGYNVTL